MTEMRINMENNTIVYHSVQDVLDICDRLKLPFWKVIMKADCDERQVSEEKSLKR